MRKRILSTMMTFALGVSLFAAPVIAEEATFPDAPFLEASEQSNVPTTTTEMDETATDEMESHNARAIAALMAGETANGSCGENLTWTLNDEGLLTISGTGIMNDYGTTTATRAPWYQYGSAVKVVDIANGATSIGNNAFRGLSSLSIVTIPNSLNLIGANAFYDCSGLITVNMGDGVTGIGSSAFHGCSALTSIVIPGGVTNIEASAFYECKSLLNVSIADGVIGISRYAFYHCYALTSVTIPSSVIGISQYAFDGDSKLQDVYYSGSLTQWNQILVARNNTRLTNNTTIHYNSEPINKGLATTPDVEIASGVCGESLTWRLNGIGTLNISGTGDMNHYGTTDATRAPWYRYGSRVKVVNVGSGVTRIGENAFRGLSSLSSVTIPNSVMLIGTNAFYDCDNLIYVNMSDGATGIGASAFHGCSALTGIDIPGGVTGIEASAFYECVSLVKVSIADGVIGISRYGFYHCYSLTSIEIPASVISVSQYAFDGDSALQDVYYSGSLAQWNQILVARNNTRLKNNAAIHYNSDAFRKRSSQATVPEVASGVCGANLGWVLNKAGVLNVSGTGSMNQYGTTNSTRPPWYRYGSDIKVLEIAQGVTSIGDNAFRGLSSLSSATIPNSVTLIGLNAFYDCDDLVSVNMGNGVTGIGGNAFHGCSALTSVTIPGGVTGIEASAFYECVSLVKVSIAEGVTSIGKHAFYHCYSLTDITIPASVITVSQYAFDGDSNLNDVYYSGSLEQWSAITVESNNTRLTSASIHYGSSSETPVAVTDVSLNKSTLSLSVGSTEKLTATIVPTNATNKSVQWTSSDTSIATVDSDGMVTAKATGTATISVSTLDGNKTATSTVSVSSASSLTTTQIVIEDCVAFPGSEFTVPVTIKDNPGISGATLAVSYDKSTFTLSNMTKGPVFESGTYSAYPETGVVLWYHTENVTDNGTLFTLHFTTNATAVNGDYNIAVGLRDGIPANLSNVNSDIVSAEFISGIVKVTNGIRGDVTGDGVVAINDVVKLARAVAGNLTLTDAEIAIADVTSDGVIAINDVVKLARYVAGNIASLQSAEVASLSGDESAVIEVATVNGNPGETVRVPVSVISNPGIAGAQLDILFDNGLTLKNIIQGDVLSAGTFNPDISNGRIQWYYDQANVTNTGVLFTLEFEVSAEAQNGDAYTVTVNVKDGITANLSDYDFNPVNAEFKPGKVQIAGTADNVVINRVSRNGNTVTANVVCADSNATVFCAVYNNSGKMIAVRSAQITGESNYQFQFDGQQFDYAKAFIVDGNFCPLCESKKS